MFYYYYFLIFFLKSLLLFFIFLYFLLKDLVIFFEWEIFQLNSNVMIIFFLFDWMSLLFMSFVLFISSMVIFYSYKYMIDDLNKIRFIILVIMFIISMMFLIMSPNLISILLGWDGLGLVSYYLVIYFQNFKSYNAGMLTALSNRIGDVILLISIAWMLNMGSWNYYFYLDFFNYNKLLLILIIMASMTKSAQIPFSSWLPAAMAAPTPVSALVHSSTLVTAGVYLLIRFNNYFFNFKELMFILLLIGSLTMFMSGLGASFETDFKKIIALSTLSQLGLMMSILSLGFEKLAFFHLLTHALFKSLLFLCAGMFIHSMSNFQDIRISGGFNMFFSMLNFNISSLALCGMPFLAGFYSKDMILDLVMMSNVNLIIFILFFFSAGLTVAYTFRLIKFTIMNFMGFNIINMSESMSMIYPMKFLMVFSVIGGSMLMWLIFPFIKLIVLNIILKLLTLFICFLGMIFGIFTNNEKFKNLIFFFYSLIDYLSLMWYMPVIFSFFFNNYFLEFSNLYKLYNDMGWMEFYGGKMFNVLMNLIMVNFYKLKYYFYLILFFMLMIFVIESF